MYLEDPTDMIKARIAQLMLENETWLRTLDYLRQENTFLKNRLAQFAQRDMNPGILNTLETYQNQFLDKDTVITLLRKDISVQELAIEKSVDVDDVTKKQDQLRTDMRSMEREFSKLQKDFAKFLETTRR
jgi:hypothetical protein